MSEQTKAVTGYIKWSSSLAYPTHVTDHVDKDALNHEHIADGNAVSFRVISKKTGIPLEKIQTAWRGEYFPLKETSAPEYQEKN